MSEGGQTKKQHRAEEEEVEQPQASTDTQEDARELLDDVDELLDEIDEVLEENAEEFIKNYVQKGGE